MYIVQLAGNRMIKPELSVIVCTYNGEQRLQACLNSLSAQTADRSLFEIIIVNNNSTDATAQIARRFCGLHPNARLVDEPNQGLSRARNLGWQTARGRYVAFLDDDATAAPDWCARIIDDFTTVSPRPAAVGGPIFPDYENPPPPWFPDRFETRSWGDTAHFLNSPYARFGFSGSNMAFDISLIKLVGGFRVELGIIGDTLAMGEESDLFSRIYDHAPLFWYDPQLVVRHWTPIAHFSLRYRFKRRYLNGAFMARHTRRIFSADYACKLIGLIWTIIKFPLSMLKHRNKVTLVCLTEDLGRKIGYLFGRT